jgi:hypothetical protein
MPKVTQLIFKGEVQFVLELEDIKNSPAEKVVPVPKMSDEAQEFVSEEDYSVV